MTKFVTATVYEDYNDKRINLRHTIRVTVVVNAIPVLIQVDHLSVTIDISVILQYRINLRCMITVTVLY